MTTPLVSLVVPTYNGAPYVRRMIDSIIAQTCDDWELIIVDGTSRDGIAQHVAEYKSKLGSRLTFIEEPNQGCNAARNTGIDASRGEFVAFLDIDDEFMPTKLERQLELFRLRPDLGLVYCDYSYIDLEGEFHRSVFDSHVRLARQVPYEEIAPRLHVCSPDLFEYLIQEYFIATIVGMVRRSVLGTDIRFHVDNWYGLTEWMFYLDIVRRSRAGYVNEPLCLNHFVRGSISRTSRIRNNIDHRNLLQTMKARYADCSTRAKRTIRANLAQACRQLGMQSYKKQEFGSAIRYFAEAMCEGPRVTTAVHLLQSAGRWGLRMGQPGNDPRVRLVE